MNAGRPEAGGPGRRSRGGTRWRFGAALLCCVVVGLGVAWVAGRQPSSGQAGAARSLDAVRLGPASGEAVADYLAGLPARLPPRGAPPVPALVQLTDERSPSDTIRLLAGSGVTPVRVVVRIPLPRVQTALRFEPLPPVDGPPAATLPRRLELARQAARLAAERDARRLDGRPGQIARFEAAALAGDPARPCVLALLVRGDTAALTGLAGRAGVRAVDAAPEGTEDTGVALAPLLPEQTGLVGPTPDDGPIPAPGP